MKKIIVSLLVLTICSSADAQDDQYASRVKTIDSTIETLYAVISGEKGEARDWDLFLYLFTPEARLIPTFKDQAGNIKYRVMSPAEYVETSGAYLEENGFFEKEFSRETDRYGNIVQLFSSYESYHSEKDEKPYTRGINSIQLFYDGNRWWVMNIYWQGETSDNPIPAEYID